jgi:excisionase family DNA binding protein
MVQLPLPFPPDADGGRPQPDLDYLTVAQAAERLHCHERTIRRAIDRGALRAGRVRGVNAARGSYRIRPVDLEAWLFDDGDAGGDA